MRIATAIFSPWSRTDNNRTRALSLSVSLSLEQCNVIGSMSERPSSQHNTGLWPAIMSSSSAVA